MAEQNDEIASLEEQLKKLEGAMSCTDACKEIAKFVNEKAPTDPLVTDSVENPYKSAAGGGGGCCVIA